MKRTHRLVVDITFDDECSEKTARRMLEEVIESGMPNWDDDVWDYHILATTVKSYNMVRAKER